MKYRPRRKSSSHIRPETWLLLKQIGWGVLSLTVVSLLLWGAWHLVRLPQLTIDTVTVTGGETIDHRLLEEVANRVLTGEYFKFVPYRFTWFYPEASIIAHAKEIPRVKSVSLARSGTTLTLDFTEYRPWALWCLQDESQCWFIEDSGFAFALAPNLQGGIFTRFVSLQREPKIGESLLSKSELLKTKELVSGLEERGWFVRRIEFDAMGDVFYILNNDSELKTSFKNSPATTLRYLDTILDHAQFSRLRQTEFDYIDLRFGTKIYVKEERDQEELVIEEIEEVVVESDRPFVPPIVEPGEN